MACVPVFPANVRCICAGIAPRVAKVTDAARRDRLIYLLASSLLLHLALLAWPVSRHAGAGPGAFATRDAHLSATLAPAAAMPEAAARALVVVRPEAPPRGAAPRPAAPAAPPAASESAADVASPSPVRQSELASAPTANLPIAPVTTPYFSAEQLTTRPRALAEPELDPAPLAAYVASGEIALTLWIDEHGTVAEIHVENSDLPDVFAQTAAAAFRDVRFAPGEIDGHAVGSVLRVAVRYDDERVAGERDATRDALREFAVEPAT